MLSFENDQGAAWFFIKRLAIIFVFQTNNNNLFIYSALFNMQGDQKRITTIK